MACYKIRWNLSTTKEKRMEKIIRVTIEKLPEGMYLATSDDIQETYRIRTRESGPDALYNKES